MPTEISGSTGVDKIQSDAIEYGDLPTGSVLQVVQAITDTSQTSTVSDLSSPSDAISATITPKSTSSKILVKLSAVIGGSAAGIGVNLFLKRGGSLLDVGTSNAGVLAYGMGRADGVQQGWALNYLDSPSTTSATTYTLAFGRYGGSGTAYLGWNDNKDISSITLVEIAG